MAAFWLEIHLKVAQCGILVQEYNTPEYNTQLSIMINPTYKQLEITSKLF